MRALFIFGILVISLNAEAQRNRAWSPSPSLQKKKYPVFGMVTQTKAYCGGARPHEEVFQALATPRPYPGKKFYVIRDTVNSDKRQVVLSFTCDSLGNFSFRLPAGKYSIITEEQARPMNPEEYKSETMNADEDCLKTWWAKPYFYLEVKRAPVRHLEFKFHRRCFLPSDVPCVNYTGPAPQ